MYICFSLDSSLLFSRKYGGEQGKRRGGGGVGGGRRDTNALVFRGLSLIKLPIYKTDAKGGA